MRPIVNFANPMSFDASLHAQQFTLASPTRQAYIRAMPELPTCGNFIAGTCERSDVYLSRETDGHFVITCRTCRSINVWPKDRDENAGRYQAYLKKVAARQAQYQHESSRPAWSLPTSGDKF